MNKKAIISYIKKNRLYATAIFFFAVAVLLKSIGVIDITPPCLSVLFLDTECPGCGMTTAFEYLLALDIKGAWQANSLVFLVLPLALYVLVNDYRKHLESIRENGEDADSILK